MKKTKQIIALLLCLVMVVAGTVFATVAYLTAQKSVQNTFTVGQINITLDETDVDEDGKPIPNADRVTANEYHLIPGQTYVKDPTLTVEAGSEKAYVRMLVEVKDIVALTYAITDEDFYAGDLFLLEKLCNYDSKVGYNKANWEYVDYTTETDDEGVVNGIYEFRYYATVEGEKVDTVDAYEATDNIVLPLLFESITVPTYIDNEEIANLANVEIHVTGHAIQAATFAGADAAWLAFDAQNGD